MQEYIQAFIEFMTAVLSALANFLGWTVTVDDLTTEATAAGE